MKGKQLKIWTSLVCTGYLWLKALPMYAGDPQFTQFYAAPLYLNPAFAGLTPCWRVGANYRYQWMGSEQPFSTYMASADYNLASSTRINGGLGGYIFYDNPGAGSYKTFEFAPMFSYEVRLNEQSNLRFGLQPSYHLKNGGFGTGSYVYGNQLNNVTGNTGTGSSDGLAMPTSVSFFDLSTGILLYSDKYWLGLAAQHLLRNPLMTDIKTEPVPMKVSVHGGFKIELNDYVGSVIKPAFNFKYQGAAVQTDVGVYYEMQSAFILGAWYRGIPFLTGQGLNTDAVAVLVGYQKNSFKVGYSYDIPLSKVAVYGTHEISLSYDFCIVNTKRKKPPMNVRRLSCPQL